MDIGSTNGMQPADGADLAERVRSAHQAADEVDEPRGTETAESAGPDRESVDEVGRQLRASLETLVADVVSPQRGDPDDLLGRAVEAIVDHRIDRGELPADENYRDQVVEQLRNDPVVVTELDDILQSIAREMAVRGD